MRIYLVCCQSPTTTITLSIAPSLSPPCRAGFPSIVACETESAAQRSILPGQIDGKQSTDYTSCSGTAGHQHSSWTPGPTSWAMGAEVKRQKRGGDGNWLMGSETPDWGGGIWSWHEVNSLCSHLVETIRKQWIITEGEDQGGWKLYCWMTHWLSLRGEEACASFSERNWCVYSITSSNTGSRVTHWLW